MKLAFKVSDSDPQDPRGAIVFAKAEEEAKQVGAYELLTEPECLDIERSPDHDKYAELDYVPAKVLYDEGWWYPCNWCERRVSETEEYEDDDGNFIEPVFENKNIFCSSTCHASWNKSKNKHRDA
jgi:hypothetical protein